MRRPATISLLLLGAAMFFACREAPRITRHVGGAITDVIILKDMYDPDENALAVTDPIEIEQLRQLVADNPHAMEHACGYHWLICFRDPKGNVSTFAHNEDCEVYWKRNWTVHRVLRHYFAQIRKNPRTFIFNVAVPASISPEQAVRRTAGRGNTVFFLDGTESRFPSIKLEVIVKSPIPHDRKQWDAATEANRKAAFKRMDAVLSEIAAAMPGTHHAKPENLFSSFGGNEIEDRVETRLYFPLGMSPQSLQAPPGVQLSEATVPASYLIQVATPDRSPRALQLALRRQLGADVAVAPYPKAP